MTARVFFSAADGRLRAPWRLLLFVVFASVASAGVPSLVYPLVAFVAVATNTHLVTFEWFLAFAVLLATGAQLWWVEKRPWSFVALGREAARLPAVTRGLLVGALAIAVPSLCLVATGALRVVPGADTGWGGLIAVSVSVLAPAALWEELLFRGYAFAVLRDVWGWRIALAVSSIVFGLLHLGNLGWTVEAIAMVMLAGVMLGGVVLVTNSLYAAWAAHLGWNLVLALGLHASVSGYGEPAPAYRVVDAGPAWLTGGGWGPEGGVAAGLGMLAGLWYLTRYARKREHA